MTDKQIKLIDMVLAHEGGWSGPINGDNGGETYRGIARNFFPKWGGWKIVDANKPLKREQIIKNSNLEDLVRQFYLTTFYNPLKIDSIENKSIATHLFDFGVNHGIAGAAKKLQMAINNITGANIMTDGKIGPISLSYLNGKYAKQIAKEYIRIREHYYRSIGIGVKAKFLKGWLNRVKLASEASEKL